MMPKKHLIAFLFLLVSAVATSQTQPRFLYLKLNKSIADTNRVTILENLGKYYQQLPERHIKNIDSSIIFFDQAVHLSEDLHVIDKEMEARSLLSGAYFGKSDLQLARNNALQVIEYYHKIKDIRREAKYADQFAKNMPAETDEQIAEDIKWYVEAGRLYGLVNDIKAQISTANNIAYLHFKEGNFDLAEQQYLDVINRYNAIGFNKLTTVYASLVSVASSQGDLKKKLSYQLKLIDNMEATADTSKADQYYCRLGDNYYSLGMYEDAVKWGNRGLQFALRNGHDNYVYVCVNMLVAVLPHLHRAPEALALIQQTMKKVKPVSIDQQLDVYQSLGFCYSVLGQYDNAEQSYIKADSLFTLQNDDKNYGFRKKNYNNMVGHEVELATFYYRFRKYDKAKIYINKAFALVQKTTFPTTVSYLHREQYKIDSAMGDYSSALKHLVIYKRMEDSLFSAAKSKQIADLNIRYETGKKEQAIKTLQDHERQALLEHNVQQAQLKQLALQHDLQAGQLNQLSLQRNLQAQELKQVGLQRTIQAAQLQKVTLLRRSEAQRANYKFHLQQAQLQRANTQRNVTIATVAALLLISGLAYNGYRNKRRSNQMLKSKQTEINRQNTTLQELLTEKDWLLKEVHHRVKNNLQIVMSLLNSQSIYLENSAAVEAIRESQSRVQAIALIHQKLYSGNNSTSIYMPTYVNDLLSYLGDSFDICGRQIKFEQYIDQIHLDLGQAVPLGLILNESVTNAIKYAFGPNGGIVTVALQLVMETQLMLTIADNGKGLPDGFNFKYADSLGMEMMKALSKQLDAHLSVENKGGLHICISFKQEILLNNSQVAG